MCNPPTRVDSYVRPMYGLPLHSTLCHDLKYIQDTDSTLSSTVWWQLGLFLTSEENMFNIKLEFQLGK